MATPRTGKPNGRPSSYRDEYAKQVFRYALLGATDMQLADAFEVSITTIDTWKRIHPEFLSALKRGKLEADAVVASSLFHRARGYSQESVKVFLHHGQPVIVPYTEHFPPDPTSCIFWLKNRQHEVWRDKPITIEVGETAQDRLSELIDLKINGPASKPE